MRMFLVTGLAILLAVLVSGCSSEGTASETATAEDRLKRGTSETLSAATDYAAEKRKQFQAKLEKQLQELDVDIDKLKERAEKAGEQARAKIAKQLPELEEKKVRLEVKLEDLKTRSGKAWDDMSTGTVNAMEELRKSFEKAKSRFE